MAPQDIGHALRRLRVGDVCVLTDGARRAVVRRQASRWWRWADAPYSWDAYTHDTLCRSHIPGYTRDACVAAIAAWFRDGVLPDPVWAAW